ncbi:FecR family protein [Odoribacter splanchnicus]|uniref:FecR family protein n=1 Tax=Odoribacter splanchnicus TaxID=28118 RepID=UPI001E472CAB|nr:FecR family protein [Odoribacter splanchnicus]
MTITFFNVMAYPDERHTEITLLKGAVVVEAAGRNQYIKPGQQVQVDNVSKEMNCREVNAGRYASWKDGLFDFEGMKLEDLAVELSRWYDVDFFFIHAASGQKKFTGAIKRNNSLQFMLDFIEKTSDVRFEVKENVVRVYNR